MHTLTVSKTRPFGQGDAYRLGVSALPIIIKSKQNKRVNQWSLLYHIPPCILEKQQQKLGKDPEGVSQKGLPDEIS